MFQNIGTPELIIGAIVLIAIFGSKKIVEIAGSLGESTKELKKAKTEFESTDISFDEANKKEGVKELV